MPKAEGPMKRRQLKLRQLDHLLVAIPICFPSGFPISIAYRYPRHLSLLHLIILFIFDSPFMNFCEVSKYLVFFFQKLLACFVLFIETNGLISCFMQWYFWFYFYYFCFQFISSAKILIGKYFHHPTTKQIIGHHEMDQKEKEVLVQICRQN